MHDPAMSAFIQLILRWFHVFFGVIWIGHLYFFNFVNVPFQAALDKELKPKVNPALLLRALWWFRWGAMWTFLIGWFLFSITYLMGGNLYDADGGLLEPRAVDAGGRAARLDHVVQRLVRDLARPEADSGRSPGRQSAGPARASQEGLALLQNQPLAVGARCSWP